MVASRVLKALACRAQCPGAKVEAVPLDLASLASVRALADKCLQGGRPLSVLVNNAGAPALGSLVFGPAVCSLVVWVFSLVSTSTPRSMECAHPFNLHLFLASTAS